MENPGQKRTGSGDELPADKRACSSLEFRPSSSLQAPIESTSSTLEAHDGDMDTSSHHSGSTRSDGEGEKDSAYGSCDSDGELRENSLSYYQRQRAVDDHEKLRNLLASFGQEVEESRILASLTELCELLSFCTDGSISSVMADTFSSILVKNARHESNPDIMLFALRAITYLCDVHPRSSSFLVRHDAVPALCQRLMAIEYLDVAEQCLQALDKIAHEQPIACLQSGAIMAVLTYIDFFSTSLQRVALSTVVNICKKLPSEYTSHFMDAVPTLCNLLQYEDKQIVENASTCLIKIVERVRHSTDMLGELCKHGLVHQAIHFIDLNCRTTLCRPVCTVCILCAYILMEMVYSAQRVSDVVLHRASQQHLYGVLRSITALTPKGLIGLLDKLASGSIVAVRTLFELNVSRILKDVLLTYDLSQQMPSVNVVDGHCNQVQEVLKLLDELLPSADKDNNDALHMEKESFLTNEPDNLQKFGTDMLPVLIQVFDSGASVDICYGSLAVIRKFIYFSKADMLVHLLKDINFSSFLAGVFTRKDQHVLMLALQIADTVMQKVPDIFNSFLKEGVLFAVDALLMPEKPSQFMFGVSQPSDAMRQKSAAKIRCLCYAFDTGQSPDSAKKPCKLEQDSIYKLAKQIKTTYFATETLYPDQGITDVLLKLRALATALKNLMKVSSSKVECRQKKEEFGLVLHQIMAQLYSSDHTSTFEIIESGILKELVNYLSDDEHVRNETQPTSGLDQGCTAERRSEVFGRLFLSSSDAPLDGFPLSVLVQKLHTALSSVENFPVIRSIPYRQRNSYAAVPNGRYTSYPCLRVQFIRGEGETCLSDHSQDVVTVDPFTSLDTIEKYLWPKVSNGHAKPPANHAKSTLKSSPPEIPSDMSSPGGNPPDLMECDSTFSDIQEDKLEVPHPVHDGSNTQRQATSEPTASSEIPTDNVENLQHISLEEDTSTCSKCCGPSSDDSTSPKLLFYLEEQHLDRSLSLYQVILQRQINSEHENVDSAKLWSEVYKVTYRRAAKTLPKSEDHSSHDSSVSERLGMYWQFPPLSSGIFVSSLEKSNPLYDVLFLLKSLEQMNRLQFHLISQERITDFVDGKLDNLDSLKERMYVVPQNNFLSSKLTEKLEQQMQDPLALSIGGMPSWCKQLMTSCPFLFSFEARCKYFRLTAFGQPQAQQLPPSSDDAGGSNSRRQNPVPRKKFLVCRDRILESAAQMMNLHAHQKAVLEVEYSEEVGTGLGPTLEFYTLVSREFQKYSLGMWRGDHNLVPISSLQGEDSKIADSCEGLFPRPWSPKVQIIGDLEFSEVVKKFTLLGKVVGKALQDGRFLDIPFSRAFYKLILGQELNVYDIHSFDPELGRALLEFQAVVERNRFLKSVRGENTTFEDSGFRNTAIKDLCLDFTLPGYPDFSLTSAAASEMVTATNLEEYVSLVVDATINAGIRRQVEAFRSGVNQVFPISHLEVFNEEELERVLCGERDLCCSNELLDHIKVDHGYSASSPPITNLLEIIREFDREQQRAFIQFATGTPRLPPGGLASLNPKLTIVRKHSSSCADDDLPSVMTCANYLKLPPYSSKEKMKEKLLYAITEGQGSFHLS